MDLKAFPSSLDGKGSSCLARFNRGFSCFHEWETCCTVRNGLQHWPMYSITVGKTLHPSFMLVFEVLYASKQFQSVSLFLTTSEGRKNIGKLLRAFSVGAG